MSAVPALNVDAIRRDFPVLSRQDAGMPIVYLDSAATSLKPAAVIDAIVTFYENSTANVGRGVHRLATEATEQFDEARDTIASFINAEAREVIFVRNTTEAINCVARSVAPDACVACATTEHHSNLLPWLQHSNVVNVAVTAEGRLDLDQLRDLLETRQPELLAVSHVSNAFGTIQPIQEITALCRSFGTKILVDGSQSVPHHPVDVQALDCDYLCFSGHKMCGPTGIGILYARFDHMEGLEPQLYGGGMVESVAAESYTLAPVPTRMEAGTPYIEGAIGLAAACDYLDEIGMDRVAQQTDQLLKHALEQLADVPRLRIHGPVDAATRSGSVTWTIDGVDSHTTARVLSDRYNICVRSGLHCAEPAHQSLNVPPSVRASFYLYNTREEIDLLAQALRQVSRQPPK